MTQSWPESVVRDIGEAPRDIKMLSPIASHLLERHRQGLETKERSRLRHEIERLRSAMQQRMVRTISRTMLNAPMEKWAIRGSARDMVHLAQRHNIDFMVEDLMKSLEGSDDSKLLYGFNVLGRRLAAVYFQEKSLHALYAQMDRERYFRKKPHSPFFEHMTDRRFSFFRESALHFPHMQNPDIYMTVALQHQETQGGKSTSTDISFAPETDEAVVRGIEKFGGKTVEDITKLLRGILAQA